MDSRAAANKIETCVLNESFIKFNVTFMAPLTSKPNRTLISSISVLYEAT